MLVLGWGATKSCFGPRVVQGRGCRQRPCCRSARGTAGTDGAADASHQPCAEPEQELGAQEQGLA
eukprot:9269351-Alexandrium_andersonii.AAC.1